MGGRGRCDGRIVTNSIFYEGIFFRYYLGIGRNHSLSEGFRAAYTYDGLEFVEHLPYQHQRPAYLLSGGCYGGSRVEGCRIQLY